jgi:hypothetical protein
MVKNSARTTILYTVVLSLVRTRTKVAQPVAVQSRFEEKTEEFELLPHHEETLFYVRAGTVHYGTEEHSQSLWRNTVATYVLVVRMCCACWIDYFISIIFFCVSIDEL